LPAITPSSYSQGKDYKGKTLYAGRAQKKTERSAALKAKFDEVGRTEAPVKEGDSM
jgi:hypothetical protein